jgi:hypothetical protein
MRPDDDVEFWHKPLLFVQGEEAYNLIELDELDRDLFLEALWNCLPEHIDDIENKPGRPQPLNYRVEFHTVEAGETYRIGYTTGDGGCLGVDLIVEKFVPIEKLD